MKNDISWLLTEPIAHRGLHDLPNGIAENSLPAFARAVDFNFAIELDVHLLADGNIAVFHDYDLTRACGDSKAISACTAADLSTKQLFGTECKIPLLTEVLELVDGKVPLLIELKSLSRKQMLNMALAALLDGYHGHCAVQAFDPLRILWFHNNAKKMPRGQLSFGFTDQAMPKLRRAMLNSQIWNKLTRPDLIAYNVDTLTDNVLAKIRRQKIPLLLWTVNTPDKLKQAAPMCDNIIFESLELGQLYRQQRGLF